MYRMVEIWDARVDVGLLELPQTQIQMGYNMSSTVPVYSEWKRKYGTVSFKCVLGLTRGRSIVRTGSEYDTVLYQAQAQNVLSSSVWGYGSSVFAEPAGCRCVVRSQSVCLVLTTHSSGLD